MKPWYKSRTIWANLAIVIASILGALHQFLPILEAEFDPRVYMVVLFLSGVINVFLRSITRSGIIK